MGKKASLLAAAALALIAIAGFPARRARGEEPRAGVDPQAVAALEVMGAFLRGQKALKVVAETTTDDVVDPDQKIQIGGSAELDLRRPDRLRAQVTSDRSAEQMFYDGKTFTVFQPADGRYATFAAPPTLGELLAVAEQRYGLDLPLADLLHWASGPSQTGELRSATRIGTGTVRGTRCDHYAFRQADFDWEIWIEEGARPVPLKLVVTTTTEPTRPQHVAVLTWELPADLDDSLFRFTPPATGHRVEIERARDDGP